METNLTPDLHQSHPYSGLTKTPELSSRPKDGLSVTETRRQTCKSVWSWILCSGFAGYSSNVEHSSMHNDRRFSQLPQQNAWLEKATSSNTTQLDSVYWPHQVSHLSLTICKQIPEAHWETQPYTEWHNAESVLDLAWAPGSSWPVYRLQNQGVHDFGPREEESNNSWQPVLTESSGSHLTKEWRKWMLPSWPSN
jgi:hypothetical protein